MDHLNDQVGAETRIGFTFGGREVDVGEAVGAMPELGGDEFLKQRVLRAAGDGDIAAIGERSQLERILQTLFGFHVTGDDGKGAYVKFGRSEREHDGDGVIGAGVGIDDDFLGVRRRGTARG